MKVSIKVDLSDSAAPMADMFVYGANYKEDTDRLVKISRGLGALFRDYKKPVKQEVKK